MKQQHLLPLFLAATAASALAAPLSDYTSVSAYSINEQEASAVTYKRDTNTLITIGDEGRFLTEYSTSGVFIRRSAIAGLADSEGVSYIGNDALGRGRFFVADERIQKASIIIQTGNLSTDPGSYPAPETTYSFGPSVGNIGLEGVSYDPLTNTLWGVKEKDAQLIYSMDMTEGGSHAVTNPFDPAPLGLLDLSDIYMMSNSAAFAGTDRAWNLLVVSQESKMLLELTRTGEIVSSLDLSLLGLPKDDTIEGVTMDDAGTLYLVAEGGSKSLPSHMYVLNAVPEPSTYGLVALAMLSGLAYRRFGKRKHVA